MNEVNRTRIEQMKEEIVGAIHEVAAALDGDDEKRQIDTYDRVEALAGRYRAMLTALDAAGRAHAEKMLERRMIDLRRDAAQLTKRVSGSKAQRAVDAGFVPFLERRAPPRSIEPPRAAPTRHTPRFRVGGEVEAWCGKCRDRTEHHIVAMVGEQPKQVICLKCQSRHNYRTEPSARSAPAPAAVASGGTQPQRTTRVTVDVEASRRADAKRALEQELQAVEAPRAYDPRERYKPNEIIVHPEHGRGKVENVLRGSMLVRFRDGLRPLNLK